MKLHVTTAIVLSALISGQAAVGAAADRDSTNERLVDQEVGEIRSLNPDNTEQNREVNNPSEDRTAAITAEDQSSSSEAIEVTRNIRKEVTDRADFSTYARNVKIITDDEGTVTLRGPVRSASEKSEIERIARSLAGGHRVNNQIEVAKNTVSSTGEQDG